VETNAKSIINFFINPKSHARINLKILVYKQLLYWPQLLFHICIVHICIYGFDLRSKVGACRCE